MLTGIVLKQADGRWFYAWVDLEHTGVMESLEAAQGELLSCLPTSPAAPGAPSSPYSPAARTIDPRPLPEIPPATMLRAPSPPSGVAVGARWACLACTERTRGGTVFHAAGEVCPNGGKP